MTAWQNKSVELSCALSTFAACYLNLLSSQVQVWLGKELTPEEYFGASLTSNPYFLKLHGISLYV